MNALDYVLLGILAFCLITGYLKGFTAQILQIIAIVGSFILAAKFYLPLADNELLRGVRETNAGAAQVIAFLGIFFITGALFSFFASVIAKKFRNEHIRGGDRMLGALLSTAKGVLILGGIALGLQQWQYGEKLGVPSEQRQVAENFITESYLVPHLSTACLALVGLIPQSGQEKLREIYVEGEKRFEWNNPPGGAEGTLASDSPAGDASGVPPAGASGKPGLTTSLSNNPANPTAPSPLLDFVSLSRIYQKQMGAESKVVPATTPLNEGSLSPGTAKDPGAKPDAKPDAQP